MLEEIEPYNANYIVDYKLFKIDMIHLLLKRFD